MIGAWCLDLEESKLSYKLWKYSVHQLKTFKIRSRKNPLEYRKLNSSLMQENRRSALTFGQLTGEICEEKRVFRNLSLFLLDENKLVYAHVKL